jgi:hypothetical protein
MREPIQCDGRIVLVRLRHLTERRRHVHVAFVQRVVQSRSATLHIEVHLAAEDTTFDHLRSLALPPTHL